MHNVTIPQFADELAFDMIAYAKTCDNSSSQKPASSICVTADSSSSTSLSTLTVPIREEHILQHTQTINTKKQFRCIWCSRVHLVERKTTLKCAECGVGFCRNTSGRNCWASHVALGGPPAAPKWGTKKRKCNDMDLSLIHI